MKWKNKPQNVRGMEKEKYNKISVKSQVNRTIDPKLFGKRSGKYKYCPKWGMK